MGAEAFKIDHCQKFQEVPGQWLIMNNHHRGQTLALVYSGVLGRYEVAAWGGGSERSSTSPPERRKLIWITKQWLAQENWLSATAPHWPLCPGVGPNVNKRGNAEASRVILASLNWSPNGVTLRHPGIWNGTPNAISPYLSMIRWHFCHSMALGTYKCIIQEAKCCNEPTTVGLSSSRAGKKQGQAEIKANWWSTLADRELIRARGMGLFKKQHFQVGSKAASWTEVQRCKYNTRAHSIALWSQITQQSNLYCLILIFMQSNSRFSFAVISVFVRVCVFIKLPPPTSSQ